MEIEVQERTPNPLLNREELVVKITHDSGAIPSRESVVRKLSAQLNKDKEQVIVRRLDGQFGKAETIAQVFVYETAEDAEKIERPHIIKRHKKGTEEAN